jgi:hypothetical protein
LQSFARGAILALYALLCGCSAVNVDQALTFTDPSRYLYFNCDQLNAAANSQRTRARDLKTLMDKAEQGFAGTVVGTMAYRADYIAANEDLKSIEANSRAKKCVTPSTWQSNSAIH